MRSDIRVGRRSGRFISFVSFTKLFIDCLGVERLFCRVDALSAVVYTSPTLWLFEIAFLHLD